MEGAHGDQTTFKVAAQLKEFGVTQSTALDLMLEHWNERCSPPWEGDDLKLKVANAYQYSQKSAGSSSVKSDFGDVKTGSAVAKPTPIRKAWSELPEDNTVRHREWIFSDMFLAGQVTIIAAPGGAGKSTLSLQMGISKATGRNFMGLETHGKGNVLVWNQEDNEEEMHRRGIAIAQHYGIQRNEFCESLFIGTGETQPLRIAKRISNGLIVPEDAQGVIDIIREDNIRLALFDPLAELHTASENINEEMLQVAMVFRQIARITDCAIGIVHHTKKPPQAGSEGFDGEMDALRGASSISGVARAIYTFYPMHLKDARIYDISGEQRRRYVKLTNAKGNMTFNDTPRFFERHGELINPTIDNPDGEEIGILKPVKLTPRDNSKTESKKRVGVIVGRAHQALGLLSTVTPMEVWRKQIYDEILSKLPDVQESSYPMQFYRIREYLLEQGLIMIGNKNVAPV